MRWITTLFFGSFLFGTLVSVSIFPGVTVYMHDVFLMLLLISSIFTQTKQKVPAKLTKYIAGFTAVSLISLVVNSYRISLPELSVSSLYLVRWVLFGGLYAVILRKQMRAASWLLGLYGVGVGFGILGLFQFFLYPDLRNLEYLGWDPHYYRVFSTLLDPNYAGIIFVLAILLGYFLYERQKSFWIVGLTFIPFVSLILTFSRSSYLAFLGGTVALAFLERKWKKLTMCIAVFVILFFVIPYPGREYLHMDRIGTSIARIENWRESFALIQKSPVFGYGFNTLRYVQNQTIKGSPVSHAGAGVDNSFLFILATTGIVGFVAYVLLIVAIVGFVQRVKRIGKEIRVFGHVVLASLVSLSIHSQFVNSLFFPQVMIWIWILVSVCEVCRSEELF